MYSALLANASFHELLLAYDRDLADTTRARGCVGARRAALGQVPSQAASLGPDGQVGARASLALQFLAAPDGCREVVLLSMMSHGVTERRFRRLRELIGVAHVLDDDEPQSAEVGSKASGLGSSWPLELRASARPAGSSRGASRVAVWSSKGAIGLYKRLSANSKGAMGRNRDASPSSRSIASPWSRRSAHAGM